MGIRSGRLHDAVTQGELTAVEAQSADKIKSIQNNPNIKTSAVITFFDDDANPLFNDIWAPIIAAKGIKITIPVVTGRVGGATSLSLSELLALQAAGHSIVSHTATHLNTTDQTVETLESEYATSKQWLIDNGFVGSDVVVYPGGIHDFTLTDIKNAARKYYRYAVATDGLLSGATYSSLPMDNWAVPRPNGDTLTEAQLKAYIDTAIAEKGWLNILTHSYVLNGDKAAQMTKLSNVIDYAIAQGAVILPYLEAELYKGNAVAAGEYTDHTGTFISNNGLARLGGSFFIPNTSRPSMDALITTYPKNSKSIMIVDSFADTLLATGGVVETFRGNSDLYAYQTYKAYNSDKRYDRKWNNTGGAWGAWGAKQYYTTGFWTPVLYGSTTAGTHTYTNQEGSYTLIGNMMTVRFHIRITTANLDAAMAGNLRISGLPVVHISNVTALARNTLEYNNLTLGTGYTNAIIAAVAGQSYLELVKTGQASAYNYLAVSALTDGQTVVFRGNLTYQIAD